MPELPEIETVKRQLNSTLKGKIIDRVEILSAKSFQGNSTKVKNAKIFTVRRTAKALIIDLDNHLSLVIHFKMTGQLVWIPPSEITPDGGRMPSSGVEKSDKPLPPAKLKLRIVGGHPTADWVRTLPSSHTRVIFHLQKDGKLYFNDQRKFGWIKLLPTPEVKNLDFIKTLGPEPYDISPQHLYRLTQSSSRPIKLLLMDQQKLSGVGNIYVNDALFLARIDPRRRSRTLTSQEAAKLHQALVKILNAGIKYGGASGADAKYVDLAGLGGHYQEHFLVYQREGQPCPNCRGQITRITQSNRSTFFCPKCQK